jgi:hypothetical protein
MRVFLLRIWAAKNARKRRAAWTPAPAITAGTAIVLRAAASLTVAAASTIASTLRRSVLTATPYS